MARATVTRRDFLKTGAAAGATLIVGFHLPALDRRPRGSPEPLGPFKPNAWIEIQPDGTILIWTGRSEMGQGVRTAMPMIVAEELEADFTTVRVIQADANPAYGDQVTVGSRSVRSGWDPLRRAGATAREMLIGAEVEPRRQVRSLDRRIRIRSAAASKESSQTCGDGSQKERGPSRKSWTPIERCARAVHVTDSD